MLALGLTPGPAATAGEGPRSYAALGDSYTSAPRVPPAAEGAPPRCLRSAGNYPSLVAKDLGLALTDVSCAGARVQHLAGSQGADLAPQLAALRAGTDLISVGIGGNDGGLFASIIGGCSGLALVRKGSLTPCQDTFGDRFSRSIATDAANIRAALRAIKDRSPRAKVLVVGYPALLPIDPIGQAQCPSAGIPFTPADLTYLDSVERELNAMLAASAKATGATFVDTYEQSLGRDMCRLPGIRWIEPLIPLAKATPFHPNAQGQAAVAEAVRAAAWD